MQGNRHLTTKKLNLAYVIKPLKITCLLQERVVEIGAKCRCG